MIKIILVDDHTIVRKGLVSLLSEYKDIDVVAEAEDAGDLFRHLRNLEVDLIILDISLPGRSGIDALKQLKQTHPRVPILILSMHPEEQYALRVMQGGAAGYLTKQSAPEELIVAIRQIMSGKKYISNELAQQLADFVDGHSGKRPIQSLTDRELEILQRIAKGFSLTEIGDQLSLSVKTVSTYKSRMMQKLGLSKNSDIIQYAINNNLV